MNRINSIRFRFRTLIIVLVITTMTLTAFMMADRMSRIAKNISREYARLYTNELAGNFEAHIGRETALAVKASKTNAIIDWMKAEQDVDKKRAAFEEIKQFNDVLHDHNIFMAIDNSKNIYFADLNTDRDVFMPNGQLSKSMEEDLWYFKTMEADSPYKLNIDTDRFINTMRIWINVKVEDENEGTIGIVGTGIDLDSVVNSLIGTGQNKGTRSVMINDFGDIQLDLDLKNIRQNSFEPNALIDQTVFKYSKDPVVRDQIQDYLSTEHEALIIDVVENDYQYIALAPIQNTSWHVVTFFNSSTLYSLSNFIPIIWMILGMTMIFAIIVNHIAQKVFVEPFEQLRESIALKEVTEDHVLFGLDRKDEFGVLAHTIKQMNDRLVRSVPVGLFVMDQNFKLLYANPYFLDQFGCTSRDEFQSKLIQSPSLVFANMLDYDKFLHEAQQGNDVNTFDVEFLTATRKPFWAEVRLNKAPHDKLGWQYEGILINIQGKKDYEESLLKLANTDQLTGIKNRHYFDQVVLDELLRNDRYGEPLSMMIFDLDLFKNVNDTWGHDIGDDVLIDTAKVASLCLRKFDTLARWGGEEFAILMPGTDLSGAFQVAEKIRVLLEERQHPVVGKVTASFGVAERNSHEDYSEWFKRTDQAMFTAKKMGRNMVYSSETAIELTSSFVKLLWQDSLNSGNRIIDQEHQKLFTLANKLMEASVRPDNHSMEIATFKAIVHHIEAHLSHEEEIIKDTDFPVREIERHHHIHQALLKRMEYMAEKLKRDEIKASDLFIILVNEVIVDHLIKEDVHFYPYLKKLKNEETAGEI